MYFKFTKNTHKATLAVIVATCTGFLCVLPAVADDQKNLETDKRFLSSPSSEQYPLANALYLQDDLSYTVNSDGSTVFYEHDVIKLLNGEGVSTYNSVLRTFDARYEDIKIIKAQTITPEGKVIPVPEKAITITPIIDSPTYANQKFVSIEFPHCITSSIIEYELETTRKSGACKYWWQGSFMQNLDPILNSTFTLNVPKNEKFIWHASSKDISGPEKSSKNDVDTYVWRNEKDGCYVPEPSSPSPINYLKSIEVTNCPSWEEFATWYGQEWDRAISKTDKFGLKFTSISSNTKPKRQRIQDVLDWFIKNYSVEPSMPLTYTLRTPDELLDCKFVSLSDAAMLISAVLKLYGIEAYPVLATTFVKDGQLSKRTPAFEKVERVILRTLGDGGESWWINPVDGASVANYPPSAYQLKDVVFVGSRDQKPGIVTLSSSKPYDYMRDIKLDILVEDRSADIALNLTLQGEPAKTWRSLMIKANELPSNEREGMYNFLSQEICKEFAVPTAPYSYYFPEEVQSDAPFTMGATVISAGLVSGTPDEHYSLNMPIFGGDRLISLLTGQTKRTKPIDLEHPFIDEIRVHVELPEKSKIYEMPIDAFVETPYGSFRSITKHNNHEAWLYTRLEVKQSWFEAKDLKEIIPLVEAQSACFKRLLKYTLPIVPKKSDKADKADTNANNKDSKTVEEDTKGLELPGDLP